MRGSETFYTATSGNQSRYEDRLDDILANRRGELTQRQKHCRIEPINRDNLIFWGLFLSSFFILAGRAIIGSYASGTVANNTNESLLFNLPFSFFASLLITSFL